MRNSSYRFQLIHLDFCRHFLHDLKICMWFGHKSRSNVRFCFSYVVNIVVVCLSSVYMWSVNFSDRFTADLFETLHVLYTLSVDEHADINLLPIFGTLFRL